MMSNGSYMFDKLWKGLQWGASKLCAEMDAGLFLKVRLEVIFTPNFKRYTSVYLSGELLISVADRA